MSFKAIVNFKGLSGEANVSVADAWRTDNGVAFYAKTEDIKDLEKRYEISYVQGMDINAETERALIESGDFILC